MVTEHDPMPLQSMDPLDSVPMLTKGGQPLVTPCRGPTSRPDFRHLTPEQLSGQAPQLLPVDTNPRAATQSFEDWERRHRAKEAAAAAENAKRAAMPSKEESQAREIAALKADLADLRTRFARLEAQSRSRGRSRTPNDLPPAAA